MTDARQLPFSTFLFLAACSSLACLLLACSGEPDPKRSEFGVAAENGQTGSIGSSACSVDDDCRPDLADWTTPVGSVRLLRASCSHIDPSFIPLPYCRCDVEVTPFGDMGPESSFESVIWPGNRQDLTHLSGCSAFSRVPGCDYCFNEFPGCQVEPTEANDSGESDSVEDACQSVCETAVFRMDADFQATYEGRVRLAHCDQGQSCDVVVELEGQCYGGQPGPGVQGNDCSLSDTEILAKPSLSEGQYCESEPAPRCTTSEDCPRGLACDGELCGPCEQICQSTVDAGTGEETWACEGGGACATGEVCALQTCISESQVECENDSECASGELCVLSGIDLTSGRGTSDTRAYCMADPLPPCPTERDAEGNLIMPGFMCRQ